MSDLGEVFDSIEFKPIRISLDSETEQMIQTLQIQKVLSSNYHDALRSVLYISRCFRDDIVELSKSTSQPIGKKEIEIRIPELIENDVDRYYQQFDQKVSRRQILKNMAYVSIRTLMRFTKIDKK